jgi:hypothetical protein
MGSQSTGLGTSRLSRRESVNAAPDDMGPPAVAQREPRKTREQEVLAEGVGPTLSWRMRIGGG